MADIPEIFPGDLYGFSDVFYIRIRAALAGQNQDFLHTGLRDDLHLVLDFLPWKASFCGFCYSN